MTVNERFGTLPGWTAVGFVAFACAAACNDGDDGDDDGGTAGVAGDAGSAGAGGTSSGAGTGGSANGGATSGGSASGGIGGGGAGEAASGGASGAGGAGGGGDGGVAGDGRGGEGGASSGDCAENPALRVAPGTGSAGSGLSWEAPLGEIQQAIDHQAANGGGEVWVLGGVYDVVTFDTTLELRSCVGVRGGFLGNESSAEERDPEAPRTTLYPSEVPEVSASDEHEVLLEGFSFPTGLLLTIEDSSSVTLHRFDLGQSGALTGSIDSSSVRIESATLPIAPLSSFLVTTSQVAFVDVEIPQRDFQTLDFAESRVSFQRVVTGAPVYLHDGSEGFFADTAFAGAFDRGLGSLASDDGQVTVVGSQFLSSGGSGARLQAPAAFVFNSSFIDLHVGAAGGSYSTATSILAPELEVAFSTFYGNVCEPQPIPCLADVDGPATGVNNSLFVKELPFTEGAPPLDPYQVMITGGPLPLSNCADEDLENYFDNSSQNGGEVLADQHPCVNGGDAVLGEASRARLFERAAPYQGAPFYVDLSRYSSPEWWRWESAVVGVCADADAPDPGRHSDLACEP